MLKHHNRECIMKYHITTAVLLTFASTLAAADNQVPMRQFLDNVRKQFIAMHDTSGDSELKFVVDKLHIEMNVVAGLEKEGGAELYVLKGSVKKSDVVTQTISFDLMLPSQYQVKVLDTDKAYLAGYENAINAVSKVGLQAAYYRGMQERESLINGEMAQSKAVRSEAK